MKKFLITILLFALCAIFISCGLNSHEVSINNSEISYVSYIDIPYNDYDFGDIYSPLIEEYHADELTNDEMSYIYYAEIYNQNDDSEYIELTNYEIKYLISLLINSKFTPVSRDEAYALGLLKNSSSGSVKNLLAITPNILLFQNTYATKSIIGEYSSVHIELFYSGDLAYLHVVGTPSIGVTPYTTSKSIFAIAQSTEIINYINYVSSTYFGQ